MEGSQRQRYEPATAGWGGIIVLLLLAAAASFSETLFPTIAGFAVPPLNLLQIVLGVTLFRAVLSVGARLRGLPWRRTSVTLALVFVLCLAAGWLGGVSWPNSGDEYSYVYGAKTFGAGRMWNPAPPDSVLFGASHITVEAGRAFSPYLPAWSLVLVPFEVLGIPWLVNPLLSVLLGIALANAARELRIEPAIRNTAIALVLLTPFVLFQGGSLFPQTMSTLLVTLVVWAQLIDERKPSRWRKVLIGSLFGVLLLTRYDILPIVAVVLAIDRLIIRRLGAFRDGAWMLLGLSPFVAALAVVNDAVTGDPSRLLAFWGTPIAIDASSPPLGIGAFAWDSVLTSVYRAGSLVVFGGFPVLVLAVQALAIKIRRRTCRFYDALFPAFVLFYALIPFTGGHQYGPRYWLVAWPLGVLTIATELVGSDGKIHVGGRRLPFAGLGAANLIAAAASFCVLVTTTHFYIAARRSVFDSPPKTRAVILLPLRAIKIAPWQILGAPAFSADFTRNGIGDDRDLLYARADVPMAVERACRLDGREVFRWRGVGRLERVPCP